MSNRSGTRLGTHARSGLHHRPAPPAEPERGFPPPAGPRGRLTRGAQHGRDGFAPAASPRAGLSRGRESAGGESQPAQGRGDSRGSGTGIGGAGDGPPDHQQIGAGPQRLLGGGRPGLVVG
jgi:hypothetical protein